MASIYKEGQGGDSELNGNLVEGIGVKEGDKMAGGMSEEDKRFYRKLLELKGMPIVSLFLSEEERTIQQAP